MSSHVHEMIVSSHLYVADCKKVLYSQNRARYQAENMQADTFLKRLCHDEDVNAKVCLPFSLVFL